MEWTVIKGGDEPPKYEVVNASTEYPYTIADVYLDEHAHLIAASPRMHKLLLTLWDFLQTTPTGIEGDHPGFVGECPSREALHDGMSPAIRRTGLHVLGLWNTDHD